MPKVMTQEEFLVKATLKHGQYNYSQAKYSGWDSILTIICPLHGSFEQRAFKHLSGHGCSECGKDKIKKVLSKSQDKFIEECNIVHNNKYNYSKVIYTKSKNKIIVICPIHGEFSQIADDHSSGHGCSQCSIDKQALGKTMNFDQFIEKALISAGYKVVSIWQSDFGRISI